MKVLLLLKIYNGESVPMSYDLAALELSGWVEDGKVTAEGRVIVNEILAYVERVI